MTLTKDRRNIAGVLEILGLVTLDNFKNGCDRGREGGREGQSHFLRSFGSKKELKVGHCRMRLPKTGGESRDIFSPCETKEFQFMDGVVVCWRVLGYYNYKEAILFNM